MPLQRVRRKSGGMRRRPRSRSEDARRSPRSRPWSAAAWITSLRRARRRRHRCARRLASPGAMAAPSALGTVSGRHSNPRATHLQIEPGSHRSCRPHTFASLALASDNGPAEARAEGPGRRAARRCHARRNAGDAPGAAVRGANIGLAIRLLLERVVKPNNLILSTGHFQCDVPRDIPRKLEP